MMLMTMREKCLILPLCGLLAVSFVSGCQDADARARQEVQSKLESAATQFREAEFNRVVSELTPLTGGEPGQQAARGLLLAEALRELGLAQLEEAERLELEHQRRREALRNDLAGLLRLSASASSLATVSSEPQRVGLQRDREAFDRALRALNSRVAELEAPIADLRSKIDLDLREVERLRDDADELLHTALALGHADGLASFKQAIDLRRQADQIEFQTALVEIEASHDLKPLLAEAQFQLEQTKSMLEAVRQVLRDLDDFDRAYAEEVARLTGEAAVLRQRIHDEARALATAASNDVEPLYDQAVSHLERAASEASRAAGVARGDAASARMTEARCREALGKAHWSQARALADQAALLGSLMAAGPAIGEVQGYRTQLEAATAKHRELIGHARTSYEGAISVVDQVSARSESVGAYRSGLQNIIHLLAGSDVDLTPPPMPEIEPDLDEAEVDDAEFQIDLEEVAFDPSMLANLGEIRGKEALLAMLDELDFEFIKQMAASMGMGDPSMMEMMREPFNQAKPVVRSRVERGEITDGNQLLEALQQEMMRAMGMGG